MILMLTALTLSASAEPAVIDIVVEGYLQSCTGECTTLCMVTSNGSMYDPIEGLPFAWGRRKTVRLAVTPVPDPPADGSSIVYSLLEVLSDEPVPPGTTFSWKTDFSLNHMGYTSPIDLSSRTLLDGRVFTCEEATCQALDAAMQAGQTATLQFAFPAPISDPLRLVSVTAQ